MRTDSAEASSCSLCGREIPPFSIEDETEAVFCSTGCRDVHSTLGGPEPQDSEIAPTDGGDIDDEIGKRNDTSDGQEGEIVRTFLRIDGMHSATCEVFLESVAGKQDGVSDAEASYVTETIRITHNLDQISKTDLCDALSTLGYTAYLREETTDTTQNSTNTTLQSREMAGIRKRRDDQLLEMRYAAGLLFGAFLMIPYVTILYPTHLASLFDWEALQMFDGAFQLDSQGGLVFLRLYFILTGVILFFTGLPVLRGAYISLKMRRPNTDLLVAITAISAYVYSTVAVLVGWNDIYYDLTIVVAAAVTAMMFYESSIKQRALNRLTDLTVSQVDTARVYETGGTTTEVAVDNLAPGDRVLVRQGERIPVDGMLVESNCTVDEAVVTGESLPVLKRTGDTVIGGSVVTDDVAVVKVGESATSSIDRITAAVWKLQSADHGVQRRADRLAARVIGLVGGSAVLIGGAAVLLGVEPPEIVLLVLMVLFVGSPWALGLATPLSVATSLEEAVQRGIIVFDETVFERLRDIDIVVFDKTGTLTTGEMDVIEADAPPDLLEVVAELEQRASHPAANAIVTAFSHTDDGGEPKPPRSDDGVIDERDNEQKKTGRIREFTSHATGIEGIVEDRETLVGNLDLFAEQEWTVSDDIESRVADARGFGQLPVIVGRDGTAEGIIIVGDEPREGWDETITRLGERGTDVVVLTGDDEEATDFFSRHAHVTHVFASVPPEGKTAAIRRLKSKGQVAMVGDGTNDAPALAAADLGISLGGGTALAADAADIAIADDEIRSVEMAFDLARAAQQRVRRNNGLAFVYNGIAIPAALAGVFNPLTAAVAVIASGGLIAANSSRKLIKSDY
ncbi:heavy metal translocating P-type ATPase [Natrialba sp. SSL1]|uniref:heavy metal translocating P-type ATPase n=1 Tax=Natrialba sp. SSL1 TaxID=1869245 RepID=UPI0008F7EFFB|nr:copper-transporting ATPase [Natrialba sp. SSL1]